MSKEVKKAEKKNNKIKKQNIDIKKILNNKSYKKNVEERSGYYLRKYNWNTVADFISDKINEK